jgi:hypothetical protein
MLRKMYSFRHTQPELAGTIIEERIRCGHGNCRCFKRKLLHNAFYLYWRQDGKLRKRYVPKKDVLQLKLKIELAKMEDKEEKMNVLANFNLLKDFIKSYG